ncbi:MAG: 16S rRNA (adenine(1518)-N(6)/adenine(1519)-N(6))-dimethyltransferase RsmA [Lachnospiraceae bacterium]|nr:16S rRNA (adenine(1518)-N(6)/adenine(1519)-N(6))-dimethyltransferase RsmA [Lachnospiraceae bacterium]
MAYLGNPQNTIEVLKRYDINFKKKFGQNFLIDTHVLDKIVRAANLTKDDVVIEIGPGIGTLTQYLCENAGKVIAIEIDSSLIPILKNDTLSEYDNVEIINEDVLKVDFAKLSEENAGKKFKVVANLPYYITTPIVMKLLEDSLPIESITMMIQAEVAQRMCAKEATKDYGALTLAIAYYSVPYLVANVPMNCFMPRPNVSSAVVRLDLNGREKDEFLFKLIKGAFLQRRKTLVNALSNFADLSFPKEVLSEAVKEIGFNEDVRGEKLTLADFERLAIALKK